MNILAQYQSGDRELAWLRAIALGSAAFDRSHTGEMEELCTAIVRTSLENLTVLQQRLFDLGYLFARPDRVVVAANSESVQMIDVVEASMGQLPMILRVWYRHVERVDFTQAESQLRSDSSGTRVAGLGLNNSLVFLSLSECVQRKRVLDEELARGGAGNPRKHFLPLGSDASNCEPKGFLLPCAAVDGLYYNDGGGNVGFVDELRRCFRQGGFPFWASIRHQKRKLAFAPTPTDIEQTIGALSKGLKPI